MYPSRILVGLNGSPHSATALARAARTSRHQHVTLTVTTGDVPGPGPDLAVHHHVAGARPTTQFTHLSADAGVLAVGNLPSPGVLVRLRCPVAARVSAGAHSLVVVVVGDQILDGLPRRHPPRSDSQRADTPTAHRQGIR